MWTVSGQCKNHVRGAPPTALRPNTLPGQSVPMGPKSFLLLQGPAEEVRGNCKAEEVLQAKEVSLGPFRPKKRYASSAAPSF